MLELSIGSLNRFGTAKLGMLKVKSTRLRAVNCGRRLRISSMLEARLVMDDSKWAMNL